MCMKFAASGWYTGQWLRLDQTIRDLTCGDSENLSVELRLGATGLEKTGFVCFQDFLGRGDGLMWFSICGMLLDGWGYGGCVNVLVLYSMESVKNLRTILRCIASGKWNITRVILQVTLWSLLQRAFSPLSVSLKRFRFLVNMDKDTELAGKAFHRVFYELPIRSPPKARTISKKPAESSKINKKPRSKEQKSISKSTFLPKKFLNPPTLFLIQYLA